MEDISDIIREARPLYYTRKRQRRIAFFMGLFALCIVIVSIKVYDWGNRPYIYVWSEETYITENTSPIEDMGLPVDEYGLLMVG